MRRIRSVKHVQISPDYAAVLADQLDSDAYARKLVGRRSRPFLRLWPGRSGVERASECQVQLSAWSNPKRRGRTVRPAPEYLRFLGEEISSREYALSVARYARLEESYRAPSRPPSLAVHRTGVLQVLRQVRLMIRFGLLPFVALTLPALLAVQSLDFTSVSRIPWAVSFVGFLTLGLTVAVARSPRLRGWVHATSFWPSDW